MTVGRGFSIGLDAGYRWTAGLSDAGFHDSYSGFELAERVPVRAGSEEYLDSEKYQIRVRDWAAPGNLDAEITRLNRVRRQEPALQDGAMVMFDDWFHYRGNPRKGQSRAFSE